MKITNSIALILAVFGLGSFAKAQDLPDQPYLSLSQSSAFLLSDAKVRDDLKLSSAQKTAYAKTKAAFDAKQKSLFAAANPSRSGLEAADKTFANSVLAGLSPTQKKKLLGKAAKIKGPEALKDAQVGKAIGLSPAQQNQVASIYAGASKREEDLDAQLAAQLKAMPTGGDKVAKKKRRVAIIKANQDARAKLQEKKELDNQRVLNSVLTPAQRQAWTKFIS